MSSALSSLSRRDNPLWPRSNANLYSHFDHDAQIPVNRALPRVLNNLSAPDTLSDFQLRMGDTSVMNTSNQKT